MSPPHPNRNFFLEKLQWKMPHSTKVGGKKALLHHGPPSPLKKNNFGARKGKNKFIFRQKKRRKNFKTLGLSAKNRKKFLNPKMPPN